jgi:hypothetical protein
MDSAPTDNVHKALVIAVFVALALGVVASTWEAVQARRAEARAKEQSAIAQVARSVYPGCCPAGGSQRVRNAAKGTYSRTVTAKLS